MVRYWNFQVMGVGWVRDVEFKQKTFYGGEGYGYFLEPHILFLQTTLFSQA